MSNPRVRVVVYESDEQGVELEVGTFNVGYYNGQAYDVQLATPDGVDCSLGERIVGEGDTP